MTRLCLHHAASVAFGALILPFAFGTAMAQQPTSAQIAAVRSACPSDYRALCASVPPGTSASLACLRSNLDSLSAACRTAVSAATGGAAAAPSPQPSANGSSPAPATASPAPAPAAPTQPATAAAPKPAVVPTPPPALSPREELVLLRLGCGPDFRRLCGGTPPGGGRIIACLSSHRSSLSPSCVRALSSLR